MSSRVGARGQKQKSPPPRSFTTVMREFTRTSSVPCSCSSAQILPGTSSSSVVARDPPGWIGWALWPALPRALLCFALLEKNRRARQPDAA